MTVGCQLGSVSSLGGVNYTVDIASGTNLDIAWAFFTLSMFDSGGTQIYSESPSSNGILGASGSIDDVASTGQPGIAPCSTSEIRLQGLTWFVMRRAGTR